MQTGDLVKLKNGALGVVTNIYGKLAITTNFGIYWDSIDSIIEVRRPSDKCVITQEVWDNAQAIYKKSNVFIGVSYQAHPLLVNQVREKFSGVVEYDETKTLAENNKVLQDTEKHIIVPPVEFEKDHIIGEGLYQQILTRQRVGKDTSVALFDGSCKKIKQVYKLQGNDRIKSALVIY